jgi:hypothetical protein
MRYTLSILALVAVVGVALLLPDQAQAQGCWYRQGDMAITHRTPTSSITTIITGASTIGTLAIAIEISYITTMASLLWTSVRLLAGLPARELALSTTLQNRATLCS